MGRQRFKPQAKHGKQMRREVRVCKFQRARATNVADPEQFSMVLAYDKSRQWMGEFSLSKKDADNLFGTQLKFYATAWKDKEGKLHIEKFLPPQDW